MIKINRINLNNYRNFSSCNIEFNSNCNIFFGNNGSGKTNILEAISLISKGKGFRNDKIINIIKNNELYFDINAEVEKDTNLYNVKVTSKKINDVHKKILSLNDEISKDAESFLYSQLSFIIFLPEMERLFVSSPSKRRDFIDKLIFSENKNYNRIINNYKKNILERTKILQLYNSSSDWLSTVEKNISELGIEIYNLRSDKLDQLTVELKNIELEKEIFQNIQLSVSDDFLSKNIDIHKYKAILKQNREIDKKIGGAKIGPHKSDIKVLIKNGINASQLSTGQQKTLVILFLIAQCNYLTIKKKLYPILLLDEICSHLDDINRELILGLSKRFGIQIFMTGTHKSLFSFISTNANFYNITDI